MESKSFFWGMTLHPEKRYAQTALEPFHISKACIEPSSLKKGDGKALTSVYLESENEEFLLCTLGSNNLNENLDLNFNKGEKICVRAEGGGIIHLTGFLMETPEYEIDDFDEDSSEGEEEESEVEEQEAVKKKKVVNGVAKKPSPLEQLVNAAKSKEKPKKPEEIMAEIKKAEEMKKKLTGSKKEESDEDDSDEDDDSDDDDDGNMIDIEAQEEEEEEDSDDDDEGEDDSSDDDDEDEEEEPPKKKAPETPKDKKSLNAQAEKKKAETPVQKKKENGAQNTPAEKKKAANETNGDKKKAEQTPGKAAEGKKKEAKTPAKEGDAKTPGKDAAKTKGESSQETPGKTPKKTLKGGLIVEDIKLGAGPESKPGKMASVYYVGRLKSNNKQFDACKEGQKPFKFRVGQGEVIKAWDLGVAGMKVGGKRRLICPPQLAYGAKGAPPDIPPNSTLVFEVELKAVN